MCDCDYETPDFYETLLVKRIRKPRRCCECGMVIEIGDSMSKATGLWDGRIGHFYTCCSCQEKIDLWLQQNPDSCFCHGEFYELVEDDLAEAV